MVFDGHPDTISIRVVLVPTVEDVAVVLDASKRIMGKSRCHKHIFINAFEVIGAEFLHSTCAIYLGVDLKTQIQSLTCLVYLCTLRVCSSKCLPLKKLINFLYSLNYPHLLCLLLEHLLEMP